MKIYDSMDEMLTDLDDTPGRFSARFPRLTHWFKSPNTASATRLWLWASAIAEVASGVLPRHALWFPVAVLVLVAAYRLFVATVHAATCPCVTDLDWTPEPENQIEGGE